MDRSAFLTIILCFLLSAFILSSCAGWHRNEYRLDLQLKNFNYWEMHTIIEGSFTAFRKLERCWYFQKMHPNEHRKMLDLIRSTIIIENYYEPDLHEEKNISCGTVPDFNGNLMYINGDRFFGGSGCSNTTKTIAHESLHLVGIKHGSDMSNILAECGIARRGE